MKHTRRLSQEAWLDRDYTPKLKEETRKVYFINELERAEDGGYIPCIAVEGEDHYYKTDWNWGSNLDIAQEAANRKNEALGISESEAFYIVLACASMREKKK